MMPPALKSFFQNWLINTLAVLVAAHIVRGIDYDTITGLLVATLVLGFLNAFLRPLIVLLSLPLVLVTLGLFTLVINAVLLYFVGWLVSTFHVATFWSAFWGALVISIASMLLHSVTGTGGGRAQVRRGNSKSDGRKGGGGPVIDV